MRAIGVTSSVDVACKRGLAANLAASIAQAEAPSRSVVVVDVDPTHRDVALRLGDPAVERPDDDGWPRTHQLRWPLLSVVEVTAHPHQALGTQGLEVLRSSRAIFDRVVVDLPARTGLAGAAGLPLLAQLDVLIVAVTAQPDALAAARCHLEELELAAAQGAIPPGLDIRLVLTGDEASATLDLEGALQHLGDSARAFVGSVIQLWGRSEPNLGFGPTLGVPSLDQSLAAIVTGVERPCDAAGELSEWRTRSQFAEPTFA